MSSADVATEAVLALATDLHRYHGLASTIPDELEASARQVSDHVNDVLAHRRDALTHASRELQDARDEHGLQERRAWEAANEGRSYFPSHVDVEAHRFAADLAEHAVERAARTKQVVDRWLLDCSRAARAYLITTGGIIAAAQASLGQTGQNLEQYRSGAARGGHTAGGGTSRGGSRTGGAGAATLASMASAYPGIPGGPDDIRLVPVADIDDGDSNITGPESFGKGYSVQDLTWAHDALLDVVIPTLAAGGTLDDLRARDAAEGRQGTRSFADTHAGFLGHDAIRLDSDMTIANGYHRVWVAKRMGLQSVAVRVK